MIGKEIGQRFAIERRAVMLRRQQRLDLRAENQRAVGPLRVIQGLHAVAVARQEQPPLEPVPDGEGKHATHALERTLAQSLIQMQHRLGIGAGAIADPRRLELGL